jgi:hypothetical protein
MDPNNTKPKVAPPRQPVVGSAEHLLKAMPGVVRRRDGGVLTRGFLLKSDHYPTGRALDMKMNVTGAPNWRGLDGKGQELGVYGVSSPPLRRSQSRRGRDLYRSCLRARHGTNPSCMATVCCMSVSSLLNLLCPV